jgi:ribonucleotide reductase alpha subunit
MSNTFKQKISEEVWGSKYRLTDVDGTPLEKSPAENFDRVSEGLSNVETTVEKQQLWKGKFRNIMGRFVAGGRIMSNCGSRNLKKEVSLINCSVLGQIPDSMEGILEIAKKAGLALKSGLGVGYEFSTIRPTDAYVYGAGAGTSGVISFMEIYNAITSTVMSGGGRRGSQMGVLYCGHPDIKRFIAAKAEDGKLSYFNISVSVCDAFMEAVEANANWDLWFWERIRDDKEAAQIDKSQIKLIKKGDIPYNHKGSKYFSFDKDHVEVEYKNCTTDTVFVKKVYETIKAKDLWHEIMMSAYGHNRKMAGEPGVIFIDTVNKENNLWFCEYIRTANPCQPAWAPVLTPEGIKTLRDVSIGDTIWSGKRWTKIANKWSTGIKQVKAYRTSAGTFYGTENHRIVSGGVKVEVKDAKSIDPVQGEKIEGYEKPESENTSLFYMEKTRHKDPSEIFVPTKYFTASVAERCLFLRALYHAKGSISRTTIQLRSTSFEFMEAVQWLFSSVGILSLCSSYKKDYVLSISTLEGRKQFSKLIGFVDQDKNTKLLNSLNTKPAKNNRTSFPITKVEDISVEEVFDITVEDEEHTYWSGNLHVSNCGEQFLPPFGTCLLGSMMLVPYVKDAFEENASFDWETFKDDVGVASRALDNVVDIHQLPLVEFAKTIEYTRRHGLGFSGLGSILNMLRIPYGSKQGVEFASRLVLTIAQQSLLTGIEIAKEKGPAPVFLNSENRSKYLESKYVRRLLETFGNQKSDIKADILEHGMRWSHATSIQPVGTTSVAFGNNCSSGIEPVFANSYVRNVRVKGFNTKRQEEVFDPAYQLWTEKYGERELPSWWRQTADLSIDDHLSMQVACQEFIDSSISKTINIPTDYPFGGFEEVYMKAWKLGLKGFTTFRPTKNMVGVLVKKEDLNNIEYTFVTDDGAEVKLSGSDKVEYEGEVHVASNLYEAFSCGLYGNM